jgi:plasmid stability protein
VHANHIQQRYNSAMATIQIRNVPEEVHRTFQRRAAAAGQSLQEYLLAHLVQNASMTTPAEIVAEARRRKELSNGEGYLPYSSAEIIRNDRESH